MSGKWKREQKNDDEVYIAEVMKGICGEEIVS